MSTSPGNAAESPDTPGFPPWIRLLRFIEGKRISQVIYALAELNVADQLIAGPRSVADLAAAVNANPDALYRLLRVSSAVGVFREEPDGRFKLTPMGDALRTDVPYSQRDLILFNGHEIVTKPIGEILHSARTGQPSFDQVFGRSFFEHLDATPEAAERFNRAMTRMSNLSTQLLLAQADFASYNSIADIGGGHGFYVSEILRRNPHLKGTLVDLPEVCAGARAAVAADIADRLTITPGDFFGELPRGFDAYSIKAVLHDWNDEQAGRILGRVREAIGDNRDARLLLGEFVLSGPNDYDHGKTLDIEMMLRFGGKERDLADWQTLLSGVGFEIANAPRPGNWALIECRPV
jgi:multifunctional cyclase/dehydratase/O-methyltransferase